MIPHVNSDLHVSESSRRQFIKTSSVAIAGGAVAGSLSVARSAHAAGDDLLRIALIGCGGRGTGAASDALGTHGNVKLVAMADAFLDNIEVSLRSLQTSLPDRVDVPPERRFAGFDAYQHAINSDVDLVILATPPGFRPVHFQAAVDAGKHVFMEKPVAVDAPGVRAVLAAGKQAKAKNLAVGVGLQRHHQGLYLETIKRLQDGAIGDIQLMRAYWNGNTPWVRARKQLEEHANRALSEMEYQMRNWYFFNWLSGDHIVEQHIHNLDVINWLKGNYPVSANGLGGRQVRTGKDHGQIFDHHFVEFTYADGSRMYSQCRQMDGCWVHVGEHAQGTKGTVDIGAGSIEGENSWRYRGKNLNPYQVEHEDLFASIRGGNPLNEAENGAMSTMTAILGRMATYSGKVISWDEAIQSQISLAPERYAFDAVPPVVPDQFGHYPVAVPGKELVA
jgi:predicted dehydrogenase